MGAIISDAESKAEMLSRIAQGTTTMTTLKATMERREHHTQIQSQTNAHPNHIHPPLCLRDLEANNIIAEEDQRHENEMLPPPFAYFIQRPHHK